MIMNAVATTLESNPIANLQHVGHRIRPEITPVLLAAYYSNNYTVSRIAKITGYSHQWISQLTIRHRQWATIEHLLIRKVCAMTS